MGAFSGKAFEGNAMHWRQFFFWGAKLDSLSFSLSPSVSNARHTHTQILRRLTFREVLLRDDKVWKKEEEGSLAILLQAESEEPLNVIRLERWVCH